MKVVTKYITRKSLIYKTNVEYGDYTVNHIQGCSHGCKYPCYAYMMAKRFGKVKSYEEWIEPSVVANTMELLESEIPKFKDKITSLHLCFTTDPFMYEYKEIENLSLQVLKIFNDNKIRCSVLTKGILPTELANYSKENEYGITLISLDETFRENMEPNSAPYNNRINALRYLHDNGCKTWVSIEPYPTPNIVQQDLTDILEAVSFTDKIIFGKMNYNSEVTAYKEKNEFFNSLAEQVIAFCNERQIAFHIKKGTIK